MVDSILRNRLALLDEVDNFTKCFKTSIKPFWQGNILGLDVIAFDKWLEVPDEISTWSWIKEKYGDEGIRIIEKLLGIEKGSMT